MSEKIERSLCYELKTWLAYQAGSLDESERLAMEEHLLVCEECLAVYLQLIDKTVNIEQPALSDQFTDKVMAAIEQGQQRPNASVSPIKMAEGKSSGYKNSNSKKEKDAQNSRVNLLITYCAAAGIAMFFWVGGYFADLSGSFTKGVDYMRPPEITHPDSEPKRSIIQPGWTQKVIEKKQSSFIENLISKKE